VHSLNVQRRGAFQEHLYCATARRLGKMSRTIFDRPSAPVIFLNEERSGNICFESGDPGTDQSCLSRSLLPRAHSALVFSRIPPVDARLPALSCIVTGGHGLGARATAPLPWFVCGRALIRALDGLLILCGIPLARAAPLAAALRSSQQSASYKCQPTLDIPV
jgi:hypothetical protein